MGLDQMTTLVTLTHPCKQNYTKISCNLTDFENDFRGIRGFFSVGTNSVFWGQPVLLNTEY